VSLSAEGVASEACSLAGHWGLERLIAVYDDNHVQIDGDTGLAFTEDVNLRFQAYGWHTILVKDGDHDVAGIAAALKEARSVKGKVEHLITQMQLSPTRCMH
jgi:transketolase